MRQDQAAWVRLISCDAWARRMNHSSCHLYYDQMKKTSRKEDYTYVEASNGSRRMLVNLSLRSFFIGPGFYSSRSGPLVYNKKVY